MTKKKELDLDELENVNGGKDTYDKDEVMCVKCFTTFKKSENTVTHSSGCDEETWVKCPKCEYEWKV